MSRTKEAELVSSAFSIFYWLPEAEFFMNFIVKMDAVFTFSTGRSQQTPPMVSHCRETTGHGQLLPKNRFQDTVKITLIKLQLYQNIVVVGKRKTKAERSLITVWTFFFNSIIMTTWEPSFLTSSYFPPKQRSPRQDEYQALSHILIDFCFGLKHPASFNIL